MNRCNTASASFARNRRQAGFSIIELLVVLAIITILAGGAVIGIRPVRSGLLANRAMYQVVNSLREARLLAMTQNRMIRVDFEPTTGDIVVWEDDTLNVDHGCGWNTNPRWLAVTAGFDPSTKLETSQTFITEYDDYVLGQPYEDVSSASFENVFNFIDTDTGKASFIFTAEGFLTHPDDTSCDPRDGKVFTGPSGDGSASNLVRVVTILGATGRIDGWQLRDDKWQKVR